MRELAPAETEQVLNTDMSAPGWLGIPPIRLGRCSADGIGRPYWVVEVLPAAPEAVRERAMCYQRMVRLEE